MQDLRYGFRVTLKNPGFTLVAVLTLALGIAVNTTVFSWIDTVLLHPIPGVTDSRTLVAFETLAPNGEHLTTSYADFRDYRDNLKLFAGLAIAQPRALSLGEDTRAERVWAELVSGNYFEVLGVKPMLGRVFSRDEYGDRQGGYPVAVIGESLWQRKFNRDPNICGRTIRVNRQQLTIVGVVPAAFHGGIAGLAFDLWAPAMMGQSLNLMPDWMLRDRKTRSFIAMARLNPGVTLDQARQELNAVARQLGTQYPATNQGMSATVLPLWQATFGMQSALLAPLRILMAVGALVLLIACANVANLLLARASARQKEFGLRVALGASRYRVIRQMLTESLMLAGFAAVVAVPASAWLSQSLGRMLPPGPFPVSIEISLNADILLFMLAVSAVACFAAGAVPALLATRRDVNESLKQGGRSGAGDGNPKSIRGLLVIAEVALALVAIIGAGLFARSFQTARRIQPGFDARNVLVTQLNLSSAGYKVPDRINFTRRLRERLESQPGVVAVSYADNLPLGYDRGAWEDLAIEGFVAGPSDNMKIYRFLTAPGYFDLMRIPLVDGRDFTEHDDSQSLQVMIVNETFAHRYFAGANPIGRRVQGWGRWFTIVGVAKDSKYQTPTETPQPFFYVPFRQVLREDLPITFLVRTSGDPLQAASILRHETSSLDPEVSIFDTMALSDFIAVSLFPQKIAALLLSVLGAVALALAAIGLYSVMAYSIAQRTQEIGLRMALGAKPSDVMALALRGGMSLTAIGLAAGVAASLAVTRLAAGFLVGVNATDPLIFTGAASFLGAVALAACYLPARRATRVDPLVALRNQ